MGKEAGAKSGLLGKVARFIKNPTTDWADIDSGGLSSSPPGLDASQSRLALKEMIKHKRRNDLVRKREFDMLRKIRRKGTSDELSTIELTSSYSSSQLVHDAEQPDGLKRERTLRQIDEIEAQLSRSWFRKPGEAATAPMKLRARQSQPRSTAPAAIRDQGPKTIPASDFTPATLPDGTGILGQPRPPDQLSGANTHSPAPPPELASQRTPSPAQPEPPVLTQTYQPAAAPLPPKWKETAISGLTAESEPGELDLRAFTTPPSKPAPVIAPAPEPNRQASVYGNALASNLEVTALQQDPEIEEAAISFANGDDTAAELTLLKLVSTGGSRRKDVEVWLTLFDLYRVTGKSDAFDGLVPEFITLFGRSAPQWERAPSQGISRNNSPAPPAARTGIFTWASPSQFNLRALAALTGAVQRSAPPWRIDWSAVNTVEPDALPELNELFTQWAGTPAQWQFLGSERLLAVLAEQSPTGHKSVNPAWWRVRLALLRLMNAPDRFDQTALDYCITYEISPPAWTPPKSSYTPLAADGQPEAPPADDAATTQQAFMLTTIAGQLPAATVTFETVLEGEMMDSADQALTVLPGNLERIRDISFDCRALRRVDFGAAGALLNWSIEQQGQGRAVTFLGVHRLLAAFFSVVGISTAAKVVLRKD